MGPAPWNSYLGPPSSHRGALDFHKVPDGEKRRTKQCSEKSRTFTSGTVAALKEKTSLRKRVKNNAASSRDGPLLASAVLGVAPALSPALRPPRPLLSESPPPSDRSSRPGFQTSQRLGCGGPGPTARTEAPKGGTVMPHPGWEKSAVNASPSPSRNMPPKTLGRSGLSTNPPSPARHFSAALEDFGFKTPETGQDAAGNEKPTSRQVLRNRFPGGAERSRSDYERGFSKCPRGSTGRDSWSTIHAAGASRKSAPGRGNKADVVFRGEMTGPRPAQAPRASGTCVGSLCKANHRTHAGLR